MTTGMSKPRPTVILVVEDDLLVRTVTTDILEEANLRTAEARDAKEAMILLDAQPGIRVLFTDWKMAGGIDGLELAWMVHERWPTVGIILTSGWLPLEPGKLPAGARFLKKPYQASILIQEVEYLLAGRNEAPSGASMIPKGLVVHSPSGHAAGGGDIAGPPPEADKT